jgi:hypothetical protein
VCMCVFVCVAPFANFFSVDGIHGITFGCVTLAEL